MPGDLVVDDSFFAFSDVSGLLKKALLRLIVDERASAAILKADAIKDACIWIWSRLSTLYCQ